MDENIKEMLNRSLKQKIEDALVGIEGNIKAIYDHSEKCDEPTEYARYNGQICAFSMCAGILRAILRLEEQKIKWQEKGSDISE